MKTQDLNKHFAKAIDYLDQNYAYFLTNVIRIGRPKWTSGIPTAAVALTNNDPKMPQAQVGDNIDFEFMFNPEFAEGMDVDMLAFVTAHETLHIVLNHLKLVNNFIDRDRYNEIRNKVEKHERLDKKDIKDSIKLQQAAAKFNIAADCVINDYLAQAGLPVWEQACRGMKFIGEDAAYLTVTEVYERLPNQQSNSGDDEESQAMGIGQEDGRGGGAMDSHGWMFDPDFADKVADAIDKMNEDLEKRGQGAPQDIKDKREEEQGNQTQAQQQLQNSMRAGSEEGNIRQFQEVSGLELAWVKLLKEVDPDMFKEPGLAPPPRPAWHKRPRKLGANAFRDVNLPVYQKDVRREKRNNEKPAIVMALDYSGSIGHGDADRFATLALSIPRERIKLFCCTFTTSYRVFDPENPHGGGSGGTSFDPIVDFINNDVMPELKGGYPKAVIVITDGEAALSRTVTEEQAKSWLWLISPQDRAGSYYPASKNIGRRAMLKEYVV